MVKSLLAIFSLALANTEGDLHLLQLSADRQVALEASQNGHDEGDDTPQLKEEDMENQMLLEDHMALEDLELDDESENTVSDSTLPGANAHGVYVDQIPKIRGSDIRAFNPDVPSMSKCQCKGFGVKSMTSGVLYSSKFQRCIYLKKGVNWQNRMSLRGWSSSDTLACKATLTSYSVPSSCSGKRGFDHAKCTRLRAAAAYTYGTWINGKTCMTTVSTNPKMYDWAKAKDYCLTGNSYCNGIAKLTVKSPTKRGSYVNRYTFCKAWNGRFSTKNLPASWPYGGVLEVRHKSSVQLPDDEFDKYR